MTDSYHFQIEPEPRADESTMSMSEYFAHMERQERAKLERLFGLRAKAFDPLPGGLVQYASLTFPSGSRVQLAGDKIVGRVGVTVTVAEWPTWPDSEPNRAPLPHFNQRTEFDAFPDYVVFHEFEPTKPLHTSPTTDSAYPAIAGLLRG